MKLNFSKSLCIAISYLVIGLANVKAQVPVGLDHWAHNSKWIRNVPSFNGAGYSLGSSPHYIALNGPMYLDSPTPFPGFMRISLGITIPYDGTFRFSYNGVSWDGRGWGDGAGTLYESIGYSINGVDHRLSPDSGSGYNGISSDDFAFPGGEQYAVSVEAGDVFSFYLTSLDSSGATYNENGIDKSGEANFYIQNINLTVVPEPGEWMALTGMGLLGFAGVRRWRTLRGA